MYQWTCLVFSGVAFLFLTGMKKFVMNSVKTGYDLFTLYSYHLRVCTFLSNSILLCSLSIHFKFNVIFFFNFFTFSTDIKEITPMLHMFFLPHISLWSLLYMYLTLCYLKVFVSTYSLHKLIDLIATNILYLLRLLIFFHYFLRFAYKIVSYQRHQASFQRRKATNSSLQL